MKSTETLKELRDMSAADLRAAASSTERELLNLRFRHSAGQLEQSAQLKNLRRKIARTKTVLAQKLAGQEPVVKAEATAAEGTEKKKRAPKKAAAAKGKK